MANVNSSDIQTQINTTRDLIGFKQAELTDIISKITEQYDIIRNIEALVSTADGNISSILSSPKRTYTVAGPEGTQTFDHNGYYNFLVNHLSALNGTLGVEKGILDSLLNGQKSMVQCIEGLIKQYELLIKTKNLVEPYMFISRVV